MIKTKKIEDIVYTLIYIMFFSVVLLFLDKWIGVFKSTRSYETGPKFLPSILAAVILVLLICVLVRQILEYRKIISGDKIEELDETFVPITSQYVLFATVLSVLVFIYIMKYVGFIIAGLLLMIALQYILGNRNLKRVITFAGGVMFVCYVIFLKLLFVQLPRGAGIFEQISLFFY